jgi:hypothetical protein
LIRLFDRAWFAAASKVQAVFDPFAEAWRDRSIGIARHDSMRSRQRRKTGCERHHEASSLRQSCSAKEKNK